MPLIKAGKPGGDLQFGGSVTPGQIRTGLFVSGAVALGGSVNAGLLKSSGSPSGALVFGGYASYYLMGLPSGALVLGGEVIGGRALDTEDDVRDHIDRDSKGLLDLRRLDGDTWQYVTPTPKGLEILEDGAVVALVDALPAGIGDAVVAVHEPTTGSPGFSPDAGGTLLTGIQAYFKLDESSGDVTDAIAGLVGTNSGSTSAAGIQNNARSFGGSDSIGLPSHSRFDMTTNWTWSGWIRPTSTASIQTIMTKGTSTASSGHQWILYLSGNAAGDIYLATTSGDAYTAAGVIVANQWHHVLITVAGGNLPAIWVNGVSQTITDTLTSLPATVADSSFIGKHSTGTGRYFTGRIDEIGLWDRVLTNAEIADLYNSGTGNTYHAALDIAAGIGAGLLLRTYNDAVALTDVVRYGGLLTDPGAGTEDSAAVLYARTAGGVLTEVARFSSAVASFVGAVTPGSIALTDGKVLIGNGSNLAEARTLSQDLTISNTGVVSLVSDPATRTRLGLGASDSPTFAGEALLGTRPTLRLNHNSDSQSVRLADYVGSAAYLTYGISFDGTDWQRDDTSAASAIYSFNGANPMAIYTVPSGANPATAALVSVAVLNSAGLLHLPVTGSSAGLQIGGDTQLYRSAADTLRTPDSLTVDSVLTVSGYTYSKRIYNQDTYVKHSYYQTDAKVDGRRWNWRVSGGDATHDSTFYGECEVDNETSAAQWLTVTRSGVSPLLVSFGVPVEIPGTGINYGLRLGGDAQLYRSAADVLRTPDTLVVDGSLGVGISPSAKVHAYAATAAFTGMVFENDNTSGTTYLQFRRNTSGSGRGYMVYVPSDNSLTFAPADSYGVAGGITAVLTRDGQLQVPTTGSTAGLVIGGDVQLYRSAADELTIPDAVKVTSSATESIYHDSSGHSYITADSAAASQAGFQLKKDGTTKFLMYLDGSGGVGGGGDLLWYDGAAQVLRLNNGGALGLKDGITAPSTATGWAFIYVDTADGDLKIKFGDGTVKTIVTDT